MQDPSFQGEILWRKCKNFQERSTKNEEKLPYQAHKLSNNGGRARRGRKKMGRNKEDKKHVGTFKRQKRKETKGRKTSFPKKEKTDY